MTKAQASQQAPNQTQASQPANQSPQPNPTTHQGTQQVHNQQATTPFSSKSFDGSSGSETFSNGVPVDAPKNGGAHKPTSTVDPSAPDPKPTARTIAGGVSLLCGVIWGTPLSGAPENTLAKGIALDNEWRALETDLAAVLRKYNVAFSVPSSPELGLATTLARIAAVRLGSKPAPPEEDSMTVDAMSGDAETSEPLLSGGPPSAAATELVS